MIGTQLIVYSCDKKMIIIPYIEREDSFNCLFTSDLASYLLKSSGPFVYFDERKIRFSKKVFSSPDELAKRIEALTNKNEVLDEIGVVCGKFQGLHFGHMEYILTGLNKCKHLIIGITNYLSSLDLNEQEVLNGNIDGHRLNIESNPFSYFERYTMVKKALDDFNVDPTTYSIVPFPIEKPEYIKQFIPNNATVYLTIYDKWGEKKKEIIEGLGYKTKVLWTRTEDEKPMSGTFLREKIKYNDDWELYVTKGVCEYIKSILKEDAKWK